VLLVAGNTMPASGSRASRRRYGYAALGVDLALLDAIAREAVATTRTVITELRHQAFGEGKAVRGAVGARVRASLAQRGLPAHAGGKAP
jgi:hypothetical protein